MIVFTDFVKLLKGATMNWPWNSSYSTAGNLTAVKIPHKASAPNFMRLDSTGETICDWETTIINGKKAKDHTNLTPKSWLSGMFHASENKQLVKLSPPSGIAIGSKGTYGNLINTSLYSNLRMPLAGCKKPLGKMCRLTTVSNFNPIIASDAVMTLKVATKDCNKSAGLDMIVKHDKSADDMDVHSNQVMHMTSSSEAASNYGMKVPDSSPSDLGSGPLEFNEQENTCATPSSDIFAHCPGTVAKTDPLKQDGTRKHCELGNDPDQELNSIDSGIDVDISEPQSFNYQSTCNFQPQSKPVVIQPITIACHTPNVPLPKKKKRRLSSKKRKRKQKQCADGQSTTVRIVCGNIKESSEKNLTNINVSLTRPAKDTIGDAHYSFSVQLGLHPSSQQEDELDSALCGFKAQVSFSVSPMDSDEEVIWSDAEDAFDDPDSMDLLNSLCSDSWFNSLSPHGLCQVAPSPASIDNSTSTPELHQNSTIECINARWNETYSESHHQSQNKSLKMVQFCSEPPIVHNMVTWNFAYRAARKGHWELYALDRCRFQSRVQDVEKRIGYVFEHTHRDAMYEKLCR